MTYTINTPRPTLTTPSSPWATPQAIICDFGWYSTQSGNIFGNLIYSIAGQSYPPAGARFQDYTTALNQSVTFDAFDSNSLGIPTVVIPPGAIVVNYAWDLGNGATGSGPLITTVYTYNTAPPDTAATLTITDSLGRTYSTTHRLNLTNIGASGAGLPIGSGHV